MRSNIERLRDIYDAIIQIERYAAGASLLKKSQGEIPILYRATNSRIEQSWI
jgi:hypothetical protein